MNKFARWSGTPDANEREIIDELERRGALVLVIDRPVDLVVGYLGTWVLVEIKSGPKSRIRPGQKALIDRCDLAGLPCLIMDHLDDCDRFFPESSETAPVRLPVMDEL